MSKKSWNIIKDNYFVDLIADECRILHKPVGGLTKDSWRKIVKEMTTRYGDFYQKDKLVNRKKTLLEQYRTLRYLMESGSDFGWDSNKLTASTSTWEAMIARNPTVNNYIDRAFPPYEKLCMIFKEGFTDGRDSLAGIESKKTVRSSNHAGDRESDDYGDEPSPPPPPSKRSRSESSFRDSKPKGRHANREAITRIASAMERFTETLAEVCRLYVEASKLSAHTPFADVLVALDKTPDLTSTEYSRAVTVLASDPKLGDAFVLLSMHRRLDWLRSIFG